MTTLKETAQAYEPPQTKNIAELPTVDVNINVQTKTAGTGADAFTYDYVEVEGVEYRVPKSVLSQLKTFLEVNPDMTHFRVVKKGEGMKTEYTVVPLGH